MIVLKNLPELADRLKHIRKMTGMSQIEMAVLVETTQQAIQQAETGKAKTPRYLHKLSHTLDIPYEWLTMNIQPKKPRAGNSEKGFSEKGKEVLETYFAMPKSDQALLLELMKTRSKK